MQLNYPPGPLPLRVEVLTEATCWELVLSGTHAALSPAAQSKLDALRDKYAREFPGEPFPHGIIPADAADAADATANAALPPGQQQKPDSQFRTAAGHSQSLFERLVHNRKDVGSDIGRQLGVLSFFGGGGRARMRHAPNTPFRLPAGRLH